MRQSGIYQDIDISEYHSEEGISSSGVSLILDCPKRYWHEYLSGAEREKRGKHFDIGTAIHTITLEPEKFHERFYLCKDKFDLRTKAGKEGYAIVEADAAGRIILREQEAELVTGIDESIKAHSLWKKVDLSKGSVEQSVYWDGGIYKTRMRARPDFFNDNMIIDLKTTDSIATFSKSVYSYGYHRQAAMQIDGLQTIDNKKRFFAFFVVEKKAPYLTACFTLDEEALEQGRREYLEAAAVYSECLKYDLWPGYEEKFQLLSLPKWAVKREEEELV